MPWEDLARRQHGVITRAQLLAADLTAKSVDGLAERGEIVRRGPGLYLVRGAPDTWMTTLWTAVLATDGVLGYATACHVWGVLEQRPAMLTILLPHDRRVVAPPGVRLRRRRTPIPVDRHRGLPVTPRADSVLDVLGEMPLTAGGSLLDRALQQQWLSPIQITQRLAEPARGNPRLRTLARVLGDGAEAESERQLHRLLRQAGIRNWRPNHTVTARGRRYRLDVALPEAMIAIEVDGMAWHLQSDRKQQDLDRQNDLVESGWTVLRFTWNDIMYRPDYVIGRIRRAIATAAGARWGGSASA